MIDLYPPCPGDPPVAPPRTHVPPRGVLVPGTDVLARWATDPDGRVVVVTTSTDGRMTTWTVGVLDAWATAFPCGTHARILRAVTGTGPAPSAGATTTAGRVAASWVQR